MQLGADLPLSHAIDAVGADRIRLSREQLIRRIELGIIAGGRDPYVGWFANIESLERYAALADAERRRLVPLGRPNGRTERSPSIRA